MTASTHRDGDIAGICAAVSDFEEAAGLTGAALERLAREGDDGNGSGRVRVADLLARRTGVEADLVGFALRFDAETCRLASSFEAVTIGRGAAVTGGGFLRRRKLAVAAAGVESLSALLTELAAALAKADQVLRLLAHLTGTLKRCHAGAETTLEEIVMHRRTALAGLEAAQKAAEERRPPLTAARLLPADAGGASREEECRRLEADLEAAQASERECVAKYRSLDDLAALLDLYMGALNGQRTVCHAVVAKLSADVERTVLLGRALQAAARMAGLSNDAAEALFAAIDPAGPVARLLALAEKGWLNHAETMRRKAHADVAFSLRLGEAEGERHSG